MQKTRKLKKRGGMIDFMQPLKDTRYQREYKSKQLAKSRWKKVNNYRKNLNVLVDPSDNTRSKLMEIPLDGGKYTKKKKRRKIKKS